MRVLEDIPNNVEVMKEDDLVDYFCTISNSTGDCELEEGTWEDFTATFQQEVEIINGCSVKFHNEEQSSESLPRPPVVRRLASAQEKRYAANSFRMRRRSLRRPFCVDLSTEENHSVDNREFYGKYSHIRETLDYGEPILWYQWFRISCTLRCPYPLPCSDYHCNYTYERQKFQDAIITEFLHGAVVTDKDGQVCTTPTKPWLVFTAGAVSLHKVLFKRHEAICCTI